jgi:serine/threonine protein kinase
MGVVYRARDSRLDREVAIKVLATHFSSDSSLRQRLEREARAVSRHKILLRYGRQMVSGSPLVEFASRTASIASRRTEWVKRKNS